MQISFVMLLFSDQISGRGKSFHGGQTASGGRSPALPCGRKPEIVLLNLKKFLSDSIIMPSFMTVGRQMPESDRGRGGGFFASYTPHTF